MWAEDRANGILPRVLFDDICVQLIYLIGSRGCRKPKGKILYPQRIDAYRYYHKISPFRKDVNNYLDAVRKETKEGSILLRIVIRMN